MPNGRRPAGAASHLTRMFTLIFLCFGAAGTRAEGTASLELFRAGIEADDAFELELDRARIQRANTEFVDAIRTLEDLRDQVLDDHGQWDMRNVVVLTELASVHKALGNFQRAIGIYQEAVHLNRVNQGLHDVTQVEILEDLSDVHTQLGDFEAANQLQEYAFYVLERTYGRGSPAILPGLYRLATWYRRTGNIYSARALYQQAIAIIEVNFGPEDSRLIDALHGFAATFRQERYPTRPLISPQGEEDIQFATVRGGFGNQSGLYEDARLRQMNRYGDGEQALLRVVRVVDGNAASTPRERVQARMDLGDWYIVFDKWTAAFEAYANARALMDESEWDAERIDSFFGAPTPLVFPLPEGPRRANYGSGAAPKEGFVDLVYDVTDRGRVRRIDVAASEPPGLMDFRTRKAIKAARFRPRFENGVPANTLGVEYRHAFVYFERPEDAQPTVETAANDSRPEATAATPE